MLILVEHHHNAAWGGADAFPTIIMMKQLKSCMFVDYAPFISIWLCILWTV
jgi:hypothetical protein